MQKKANIFVFKFLSFALCVCFCLPTLFAVPSSHADIKKSPDKLAPPSAGDLIFNEYAADNDANGNDFFELLVIADNLDLRGLRVTDNEYVGTTLNNGEAVFVFGTDAYLASVPKGTTIAVWSVSTGVATDTTVNPAASDWKMVLAPGTGVTVSPDGLGGTTNTGFSTSGEAFYLYLPGADGTSAGTDNVYLDFISSEGGGNAPSGPANLNLPSLSDNAFYRGNTAAGNDTAANWTTYDFPANSPNVPTPGDANPGQDLSNLRILPGNPPTILENTASPLINLAMTGAGNLSGVVGDASDPGQTLGVDFTIDDLDNPVGTLTVTAASSNQAVVPNANLNLTGSGAARNLKITPAASGYTTITVTVSEGTLSSSYTINYAASVPANAPAATRWHTGKADASTAVAVDADFMFVADDEDQTIRLYERLRSGLPLSSFDFTLDLGLTDISGGVPREVDIEASAQNGSRIYWLASHSNASSGNNRPNRSRIFATDISGAGSSASLTYAGRYDGLKTDLINWDSSNAHGLGANFFGLAASAAVGVIPETPDGSGFNIEGFVFAPDNSTVYLSFRAPVVPANNRTKALIVPVTNIASLVAANPAPGPAQFGAPIQLSLGGRGIREIKKNAANEYLIVAGDAGPNGNFATYSWSGNPDETPVLRTSNLTSLNPESIVEVPANLNSLNNLATVQVQLLSDNGDDIYYGDGIIAKDLPQNEFKKFRSDIVTVQGITTVANVNASGKVIDTFGNGISRALVSVTNTANGTSQTVITNSFGFFSLAGLTGGESYIFAIKAKNYSFTPQVLTINQDVSDLNFVVD